MVRHLATRWLSAGCALIFVLGCTLAQPVDADAARTAPQRPAAPKPWTVVRLFGTDYVSLREFATRFGLRAAWSRADQTMTLSDAGGVRFTFEKDERDLRHDGARVFLSEHVVLRDDALWVAEEDLQKTLVPIFRPAERAARLPAAPPRLIVLDPGHGGTDPGKQNSRLKLDEKDMTLDLAFRVRKLLEARGYKVIMTRTTDTRYSNNPVVDLPMRAAVANKARADLFISLHFNAVDPAIADRVSGTETYVLTPQGMVSTEPERDKDMVRARNPGNAFDDANVLAGFHLHRALVTGLRSSDRGFKRYRLGVLRPLECPGLLLESAYLSNDTEARKVATPAYRQQIAEAVVEGIAAYGDALASARPKR